MAWRESYTNPEPCIPNNESRRKETGGRPKKRKRKKKSARKFEMNRITSLSTSKKQESKKIKALKSRPAPDQSRGSSKDGKESCWPMCGGKKSANQDLKGSGNLRRPYKGGRTNGYKKKTTWKKTEKTKKPIGAKCGIQGAKKKTPGWRKLKDGRAEGLRDRSTKKPAGRVVGTFLESAQRL